MRILLPLLLASLLSASPARADKPVFRVCYFSLNNGNEVGAVRGFMDRLNATAPFEVQVSEFQPQGGNPEQAFRRLLDSGIRCNALVFSGHHTGNWGGARAKGNLRLDFLENLSCDPRYRDFFRGVSAYWGEGCRTMGVEVRSDDPDELDADFHTNRVGNVAHEDHLEQGMGNLNAEFTNTLDQDNPLSSRYLRLFPNARLFGWTKRSPGENAQSHLSMLFHIAHMARLMDAQEQFPNQSPRSAQELTPANSARYANAVLALLAGSSDERMASCDALGAQAWRNHGDYARFRANTFDNPFATAFEPLARSQERDSLLAAKEIDCELKAAARSGDPQRLNAVLDRLLAQPDFLRYSFNTLVDLRNELTRGGRTQMAGLILEKMRTHPRMEEMFLSKLNSRSVGVLRKVDYYEFYRRLTGRRLPEVEASIEAKATAELLKPLPANAGDHFARREQVLYRNLLFQSVVKNGVVGPNFYQSVLARNPPLEVLNVMATQIRFAPAEQHIPLLLAISRHPNADRSSVHQILDGLRRRLPADQYPRYEADVLARLGSVDRGWVDPSPHGNAGAVAGGPPPRAPAVVPPGTVPGSPPPRQPARAPVPGPAPEERPFWERIFNPR